MPVNTPTCDSPDFRADKDAIAAYVTDALASEDPAVVIKALRTVANAYGMSRLSQTAGVAHEVLDRALTGAEDPEFEIILKVVHALGLRLSVVSKNTTPA